MPNGRLEGASFLEVRSSGAFGQALGCPSVDIGARDEEHLKNKGFDLWPETLPPSDEYQTMAEGSPVRALVKEYIKDDPDPDLRVMRWMLKDNRF